MKPLFALLLCLGVVTSSTAFAAMSSQQRTDFTASCQRQMYMSKGECACMADIADKTLDEAAITYLSLDALDVKHSAAMAKTMTAAEIHSIDHFMQTAPKTCKGAA